jgi:hypothetical protein
MKVADEIGVESGQCCGIAKHPMERDIRENDFGGNQDFQKSLF